MPILLTVEMLHHHTFNHLQSCFPNIVFNAAYDLVFR